MIRVLILFCIALFGQTAEPSAKPSRFPSNQPSKKPSTFPTSKPSRFPSNQPSKKPSKFPTSKPSKKPTFTPTKRPSKAPSFKPTKRPTKFPTGRPTRPTTMIPTTQPTAQPTSQPTTRTCENLPMGQILNGLVNDSFFAGNVSVYDAIPYKDMGVARLIDNDVTAEYESTAGYGADLTFNLTGSAKAASGYTITSGSAFADQDPFSWQLFGIIGDGTQVLLDSRDGIIWSRSETRLFAFTNTQAYTAYHFDTRSRYGAGLTTQEPPGYRIAEIELFICTSIVSSPTQSS